MSCTDEQQKQVQLEIAVHEELCRLRADPSCYIAPLRERLNHFVGMAYAPPELGGKTQLQTVDGPMGVQDALDCLQKQSPLGRLILENEEGSAVDNFAQSGVEVQPLNRNFFVHDKNVRKRAARESAKKGRWAEFSWFGPPDTSATKIVEDLLIDDGQIKRSHRSAIFNPEFVAIRITVRHSKNTGKIFCRLHFSAVRSVPKLCRQCGRCQACDRSCEYCWTVHCSPATSRATSRNSSRPVSRQRIPDNYEPLSPSTPASPSVRGGSIPDVESAIMGSEPSSAREVMLEEPSCSHPTLRSYIPKHSYRSHPRPPLMECDEIAFRPNSGPALIGLCGSSSWPGLQSTPPVSPTSSAALQRRANSASSFTRVKPCVSACTRQALLDAGWKQKLPRAKPGALRATQVDPISLQQ